MTDKIYIHGVINSVVGKSLITPLFLYITYNSNMAKSLEKKVASAWDKKAEEFAEKFMDDEATKKQARLHQAGFKGAYRVAEKYEEETLKPTIGAKLTKAQAWDLIAEYVSKAIKKIHSHKNYGLGEPNIEELLKIIHKAPELQKANIVRSYAERYLGFDQQKLSQIHYQLTETELEEDETYTDTLHGLIMSQQKQGESVAHVRGQHLEKLYEETKPTREQLENWLTNHPYVKEKLEFSGPVYVPEPKSNETKSMVTQVMDETLHENKNFLKEYQAKVKKRTRRAAA